MSATLESPLLANKAAAAGDSAYQIEKSLRFIESESTSLSRLFRSGDTRRWTFSCWIKRALTREDKGGSSTAANDSTLFNAYSAASDGNYLSIRFAADSKLRIGTHSTDYLITTREFRDNSAWFHVVLVWDTRNPVADHRIRMYINGVEETDFGTRSNPAQYAESAINAAKTHYIGKRQYSDGATKYFDGLMSDIQFYDGLALPIASLGSFDSGDNWNPKAVAKASPNTGVTWTPSSGGPTNPGQMFNGDLSDYAQLDNSAGTKTITTQTFTVKESLRVKIGSDAGYYYDWTINGDVYRTNTAGAGWYDIPIPRNTEITSFTGAFGPSSGDYIYAWEVDGVILIDGRTDSTTINNPNNGTKWSDHLAASASGAWSGHPFSQGFNGTTANDTLTDNSGATLTLTFPTAITASKLEIQVFHDTRTNDESTTISGTGITSTTFSGNDNLTNFKEIPLSGSTISTITVAVASQRAGIAGIKIDDQFLLDSANDNSFHLKLNNTTYESDIGKDVLTGKVADASAGTKPLLTTTDDYGETLGSGFETDPHASNLVMYLPLNSASGIADKHHEISGHGGSSSAVSTTEGNGSGSYETVNDNSISRFYGSSRKFAGDNSSGDIIRFTPSTDERLDDEFCIEFWYRWASNGTTHTVISNHPANNDYDLIGHGSAGKFNVFEHGDNLGCLESTAATVGNWHHYAITRQSDNKLRIWRDGVLSGGPSTSTTTGPFLGASNLHAIGGYTDDGQYGLNGNLSELRIYKGTPKYTSTFNPPIRNDWIPSNLNVTGTHTSHAANWTGTAFASDHPARHAFNGRTTPQAESASAAATMTWGGNSNLGITWTSTIEALMYHNGSISINGGSAINHSGQDGSTWFTVTTGGGTLNTMAFTSASGHTLDLRAIRIDGKIISDYDITWDSDSFTDTPTIYLPTDGDDKLGGVTRGNYCTLSDHWATHTSNKPALGKGGLEIVNATSSESTGGTMAVNKGKWYYEVYLGSATSDTANYFMIGVGDYNKDTYGATYGPFHYAESANWLLYQNGGTTGKLYINGSNAGTYSSGDNSSFKAGDYLGVAFDSTAGTVNFYKNGSVANSSGDDITGLAGKWLGPVIASAGSSQHLVVNFGAKPFKYPAPAGYKTLCSTNLDDTFDHGTDDAHNDTNKYFDTKVYTGTGAARTLKRLKFKPDFAWFKNTETTGDHQLQDSVRGKDSVMYSNANDAANSSATDRITAFNTDGVSLGTNTSSNESKDKMVGWFWNAGGGPTADNDNSSGAADDNSVSKNGALQTSYTPPGSPSQYHIRQSINTAAGLSIITYAGATSTATLSHGLGVAPHFIMLKTHTISGDWRVYHHKLGNNEFLILNTNAIKSDAGAAWNDTSPTTDVFSVGSSGNTNEAGRSFTAYCFAPIQGFSHFGSYIGNGLDDHKGGFTYTGFRPRYVMLKKADTTANNWFIMDTERETSNIVDYRLQADATTAEQKSLYSHGIDFFANGFRIDNGGAAMNTSGKKYVYAAFAANPFKTTRAH